MRKLVVVGDRLCRRKLYLCVYINMATYFGKEYTNISTESNPVWQAAGGGSGGGDVGPPGISAYDSYLNTTTDSPPKTEAEWVESLQGSAGGFPTGSIMAWTGFEPNIPSGWLACQGQEVFRHLFQDLWNLYKYAPIFDNALGIQIGNTGGRINKGIWSSTTQYYESDVVFQQNNGIWEEYVARESNINSSPELLLDWQRVYYKGIYNNFTTNNKNSQVFNLPDLRGRVIGGMDLNAGNIGNIPQVDVTNWYYNSSSETKSSSLWQGTEALPGQVGGADEHTLSIDEMPSHTHGYNGGNFKRLAGDGGPLDDYASSGGTTSPTGGGNAHLNIQPTMLMTWIVKT